MKTLTVVTMVACLMFSVASFADEIKVMGGGTSIAAVFLPIKARFEKFHGDTLSIVQSSAVKGVIALNEGKIDIATAAHPLEDLIAGAAKEGVVIDPSGLVATQIEDNRLVVISNRSNPVTRLSKAELKGVFTGKISNWQEVGGSDLPVEVVWGKETQGQNIQFVRVALGGDQVTAKARTATNYRDIAEVVARLPGGVGVVPLEITTSVTRSLETEPITSPIFIITRGKSEKAQKVVDFYKKEYSFLRWIALAIFSRAATAMPLRPRRFGWLALLPGPELRESLPPSWPPRTAS